MPRRSSKWVLHERKDGQWDVSRGGRQMYSDLSSKEVALVRMKMHHKPGEPVLHEEPDGYRTNISAELRKRGLIH